MKRKFVDGEEVDGLRGFVLLNGTEGRLSGRKLKFTWKIHNFKKEFQK